MLFDEIVTSCFCSGQVECNEAIDVLSHKLGIYRVGPGGKESRTVFERMSYNGNMSIVKCAYLATSDSNSKSSTNSNTNINNNNTRNSI